MGRINIGSCRTLSVDDARFDVLIKNNFEEERKNIFRKSHRRAKQTNKQTVRNKTSNQRNNDQQRINMTMTTTNNNTSTTKTSSDVLQAENDLRNGDKDLLLEEKQQHPQHPIMNNVDDPTTPTTVTIDHSPSTATRDYLSFFGSNDGVIDQ